MPRKSQKKRTQAMEIGEEELDGLVTSGSGYGRRDRGRRGKRGTAASSSSSKGGGLSSGWKAVLCIVTAISAILASGVVEVRLIKNESGGVVATKTNASTPPDGVGSTAAPAESQPTVAAAATTTAPTGPPPPAAASTTTAPVELPTVAPETPQGGDANPSPTPASEPANANANANGVPVAQATPPSDGAFWTYKSRAQPIADDERKRLEDEYGIWSWTDEPVRHKDNALFWTYKSRAQPIADDERKRLEDEYGTWSWTDEPTRHKDNALLEFYRKYDNRDFPWAELPSTAWQKDATYMGRYIEESKKLTMRSMEAILSEYGHGKKDAPDDSFEIRSGMFNVTFLADEAFMAMPGVPPGAAQGGWMTSKSWAGLKRRLLHALITEDSFVFAMGGHSAAAGHGNHYFQSYTLQVAWILEPIFARLGVKHQARNIANGGMGTGQNAMASAYLFGPDVDMLMWDSGMTERGERDPDLMARQAIIGGIKVPLLYSFPLGVLKKLNHFGECDVGTSGSGMSGVADAKTKEDLDNIAWAARYMKCASDINNAFCKPKEYNSTCWIPREDYTPTKPQDKYVGGRASWHPGFRAHQIRGRSIAFVILRALYEALGEWGAASNFQLDEEKWHVTTYYKHIREKVLGIAEENSPCYQMKGVGLGKLCNLPMKSRSDWSPRAYPNDSAMHHVMPKEQLEYRDAPVDIAYQPPDVHNPYLHPIPGAVDVLNIVSNGPAFRPIARTTYESFYDIPPMSLDKPMHKPGKGYMWYHPSGFCDGSLDSFCKREATNSCLLTQHNDSRSGVIGGPVSGWLLFQIPKVEHGYIVIKVESWHFKNEMTKTAGWKSINNENDERQMEESTNYLRSNANGNDNSNSNDGVGGDGDNEYFRAPHVRVNTNNAITEPIVGNDESFRAPPVRANTNNTMTEPIAVYDHESGRMLKRQPEPFCDQFRFDVSINGNVRTYNKTEFDKIHAVTQRVVEVITLLDDPSVTGDVNVAVQVRGCKQFQYSHIYWS
eukprot:CAMPEP_0119573178 /NCGR_PEP_ID=MMETSP1352-20130426/44992_1 /TAXON_ID=265584 /ORGANISM="Stauroneis constricta, Strain CCMP1120" /LENGTH=1004 /DNA_ID=CAMNT_0007622865 /DNA_START=17 /DNA_END=3032 /DNA_ORIENTATION=+